MTKNVKNWFLTVLFASLFLSTLTFAQTFTGHQNFGRYLSQGLGWGDYDNDGYQDIYITNGGETQTSALRWENYLYHNNGDGTFDSVATGALVTDVSTSGSCSWGDYDNDGDLDLIVAEPTNREVGGTTTIYYSKNSFYENNGDGTFTSVSKSPVTDETVSGAFGSGTSRITIGWTDLNNDGWIDLFQSNAMFNATKDTNSIWISNQDGSFSVVSNTLSADQTARSGFSWVDFDNDGDLDVATASGKPAGKTSIWVNTSGGWVEYNLIGTGASDGRSAAGVSWGDYDNDGDFDLFIAITRYADDTGWALDRLYRNDTSSPDTPVFTRMTESDVGSWIADSSIAYGSCWGDYDNDGYLDLFVGCDGPHDQGYNNFLIHNNGDGTFTKIYDGAINDSTYVKACAWADYDNDGDMDLITGRDGRNILFENNGNSNHWLNIRLVDTRSNTNTTAFGSRVEVYAPSRQIREVISQTGAGGQNSLRQHFGLGSSTSVDSVVVKWLSNSGNNTRVHTAYSHLPANKFMVYTYGNLNVTADVLANRTFMYLFGNTGAAVEFTSNSDADGGSVTVQRYTSGPANNTFSGSATAPDGSMVTPNVAASDRYWSISESGLSGNYTATVYLDISNMEGVNDADKLVIMSRANSSSAWQPHNTLRIGNTLYTSGVTAFSEWTVGANSADNSLPVELISFKATAGNGRVILSWKTASEIDNLGFILERSQRDNSFGEIASYKTQQALKGAGNASAMHEYTFTDKNLLNGKTYTYRLSDMSYNGEIHILKTVQATPQIQVTGFKLFNNYPNPFNPSTHFKIAVPENKGNPDIVTINIFNNLGQVVRILFRGRLDKGIHKFSWDGRNNFNQPLPSGVYYLSAQWRKKRQILKLILMK